MKLVSIDIKSDFGFFRKPETNNTINVSYNMIHKPAVLGILGAIIGLRGYEKKGELPEYYRLLHSVMIGVQPLESDNGNYTKTLVKYSNTIGYANKGATFLTEELILVKPAYRIYLLLDEADEYQKELMTSLKNGHAAYVPYFGKNEFTAWWDKDSYTEYKFEKVQDISESVEIVTLFEKNQVMNENTEMPELDFFSTDFSGFMYFERLPVGFNEELMQYSIKEMIYSNYAIKNVSELENLYRLETNKYVQLH